MVLFNFNPNINISNWKIVNDFVMGGCSNGVFSLNDEGKGIFKGLVSLDNNGGFSMVKYHFEAKNVEGFSKISIRLKGDGKTYQFRVKTNNDDKHSYIAVFNTNKDWQTIEIPFNKMYPAFRGRKLDIPNYPGKKLEAIAFLIGNKKEEQFNLEIDNIEIK